MLLRIDYQNYTKKMMQYFKYVICAAVLLHGGNISAAAAEPPNDVCLDVIEAVEKSTLFLLDRATATIVAEYRGHLEDPTYERAWKQALPADYSDGFLQPLSGNRLAATSRRGHIAIFNVITGEIIKKVPSNEQGLVEHVLALPDDRLVLALKDNSLDVIDVEYCSKITSQRLVRDPEKRDIKALGCVESKDGPELIVVHDENVVVYSVNSYGRGLSWPQKDGFHFQNIESLTPLSKSIVGFSARNNRGREIYFYNAENQKNHCYGKGIFLHRAGDVFMGMVGKQLAVIRGPGYMSSLTLYDSEDNFTGEEDVNATAVASYDLSRQIIRPVCVLPTTIAVNSYGTLHMLNKKGERVQKLDEVKRLTGMLAVHGGLATLSLSSKRSDSGVTLSFVKRLSFQEEQQKEHRRKKCKRLATIAAAITTPMIGVLAALYGMS